MPGIDWTQKRQACLKCSRGPKDKTLGVTVDERGGVAHCHRCHYTETRGSLPVTGSDKNPYCRIPAVSKHTTLSDFGKRLWAECEPLHSVGVAYLKARGCEIPPKDSDLRYHPALKHPLTGYTGPALVALVTDAVTGEAISEHRTWVCRDGTKATDPARMLLGGHRKQGGVIRLWSDDSVTHGLAIAEGVETALSLAHAFQPAWALIDAGNLSEFPVLPGIEALTIGVDNDPAGIKAAHACAARWAAAGREAWLVTPDKNDLNDECREAA